MSSSPLNEIFQLIRFFDAMELGLQFDDEDLDFTALKLGSKRDARGSEKYDPKQCAPEAS